MPGMGAAGPACDAGGVPRAAAGEGSATDRLAMLLLALSARADGRVPMASGRLPKGYNRSEATVAKLLGCSVEDARPVLKRLLALEGVAWDRPERYGEDRLLVPAIRDAYERARAASKAAPEPSAEDASASPAPAAPEEPDAGCARCGDEGECEGLLLAGDGWAQLSFEDVPVEVPGACGVQEPDVEASSQVEADFDGGSGRRLVQVPTRPTHRWFLSLLRLRVLWTVFPALPSWVRTGCGNARARTRISRGPRGLLRVRRVGRARFAGNSTARRRDRGGARRCELAGSNGRLGCRRT